VGRQRPSREQPRHAPANDRRGLVAHDSDR
jgi:hypothetical protein